MSFCVWLLSLTVLQVHLRSRCQCFFLFVAEYYSILWIDHLLAAVTSAVVNMGAQCLFEILLTMNVGPDLGVELLPGTVEHYGELFLEPPHCSCAKSPWAPGSEPTLCEGVGTGHLSPGPSWETSCHPLALSRLLQPEEIICRLRTVHCSPRSLDKIFLRGPLRGALCDSRLGGGLPRGPTTASVPHHST